MTKKSNSKRPSIDGFSQRNVRGDIGDFANPRPLSTNTIRPADVSASRTRNDIITDKDIESVVFDEQPQKKSRRQQRKEKKQEKNDKKRKKVEGRRRLRFIPSFLFRHPIRNLILILLLILVGTGGFLGVKLYIAKANIFDRSGDGAPALRSNLDPSELSGEGDGRVNILLAGIGGDNHPGGTLADTIIIASIDPFAKEVAMLSVPRDLYVDIPGYYRSSRINAAHAIGEEESFEESGYPDGGMGLLQKTLEETLDIPIHYYVRVDFSAFKHAVDAVGGIVLDVDTPVYDPTFAWEWRVLDVGVGEQYFDGERALFYARSRKTSPGGDFDRSERQRDIIVALKDKVLSLGTYANPLKIADLIDAIGNGVKTNISISEMLRLYEIAGEIPSDNIVSVGLSNSPGNYLTDKNIGGASVLVPTSGNFIEIQKFVRSIFVDGFIKSEDASLEVFNGTSQEGLATDYAAELGTYGYRVVNIGNMIDKSYATWKLFDLTNDNPYTRQYLEQRTGVIVSPTSELPVELRETTSDFIIIMGTNG